MAESLFHSILSTLDRSATSQIARKLGEPDGAVSRGLESSIAAVLAGLSTKTDDPGTLRRIVDLVPGISGGWSTIAGEFTNTNSTLLTGGKRILSALFGSAEGSITSAISHEVGLGTGSASTLLAMTAPMVTGFLGTKIREHDMTVSGLGAMLSSEAPVLRHILPSTASDLIWRQAAASTTSPVIAQAVRRESSAPWASVLAISALALGGLWLFTHNRAADQIGSAARGTASRLASDAEAAGNALKQHLPHIDLKLPEASGESRLLSFVQDRAAMPSDSTRFDFDRWRFDSGSAKLKPESSDQLDDVAAIFKAYPQLRGKVVGYTDAQGSAQANLALSEARANAVKSELVARGVSDTRLTTEGYGEQNAIADNSTESGRADNRRAALQITDK
jgi:outer membrane protein OmpA-like peptidoglycan-associated protein